MGAPAIYERNFEMLGAPFLCCGKCIGKSHERRKNMQNSLDSQVFIIVIVIIAIYLLLIILPYCKHKDVSTKFVSTFSAEKCYSDKCGDERVAYIDDNVSAMIWRIRMIEAAKEKIFFSTFEIDSDLSGKDLMCALLQAAERGVKITMLTDGTNELLQLRYNKWMKAFVSHRNVTLWIYNKISFRKPWKLQARLHDKYIIVDEDMFILGGRNSNKLFLGNYKGRQNIDREVFVYNMNKRNGNAIDQLKKYFKQMLTQPDNREFICKKSKRSIERCYHELLSRAEYLKAMYPMAYMEVNWVNETMPSNKITLLSNPKEAHNKEPEIAYSLKKLMLKGERITVYTPYIICGEEMYQQMELIRESVKEFKIITNDPASGANPWGCADYMNQKKRIWGKGMNVYEYSGKYSMHNKVILIDDRISIVGSYNLDMRSTYIDTELMLVIDSEELNQMLKKEEQEVLTCCKIQERSRTYKRGENYVEKEMAFTKKVAYKVLRMIVRPLRRFL